ncbi:ABC transporter ATP-binding protein [Candidatus Aerophobetes bacterium]|nr:ABC transporter ATP-binding protein [Candidatus Aerophobetes bacterium]MBE0477783.1 ABC transporter ATP-binding protein [Candidatus Aerophobetes bacterium]
MSRVDAKNIWKIYAGGVLAVKEVSFHCEDGEFLAILGPSGCGKSSTLRMIAGLEDITKGELLFDGKLVNKLSPRERNIALAFETYALYAPLTIYENIAFPLEAGGMKRKQIDEKVKQIADMLDLTDVLNRKPSHLSGGQQQRVSLARALIREPNVFLLDEPLSHMDQRVRVLLRARIRRIHDELKATTIYVTHDQEEAVSLADRIIVMHLGEIQQTGTVDELWNHPKNIFVAGFLGEPAMNFLETKIEKPTQISLTTGEKKATFELRGKVDEKYVGCEAILGIRPERIVVLADKRDEQSAPSLVEVVEPLGETKIVTVKLDDVELKVVSLREVDTAVGKTIYLKFKPEDIHLFDKQTEKALLA